MFKVKKLDDITVITEQESGNYNNVILIEDTESLVLVDTFMRFKHMKTLMENIVEAYQKPVKQIVFTHWHIDHTLGASLFPEVDIYATKECAAQLEDFKENHYERLLHKNVLEEKIQVPKANKIITTESVLHLKNGHDIQLIPLPGHSHDSLVASYRDYLFVGDSLVGKEAEVFLPPVIPPDAKHSKVDDLLAAIQFIKNARQCKIVTGHGTRQDKEEVIADNLSRIYQLIK